MAAAFVSEAGISVYDEIFCYLADKLGQKIKFVSGFSYTTINKMLGSGLVDPGFVYFVGYKHA